MLSKTQETNHASFLISEHARKCGRTQTKLWVTVHHASEVFERWLSSWQARRKTKLTKAFL